MNELINTIKRYYNKARIWILKIFTDRVRTIRLVDEKGKEQDVTVEKQMEKVCDHKTIREIAPTLYTCDGCDDAYFFITYKVHAQRRDVIKYIEDIAKHFGAELQDKTE